MRTLAGLVLFGLVGCAGPQLDVVLQARDGAPLPGTIGPFGVMRVGWRAPVQVTASTQIEVHAPVDEAGDVVQGPPVVFVHGGLVAPVRYRWWAEHVASRGYVVITATHPADLAFFAQGTSTEALDHVRRVAADPEHVLFGAVDAQEPAAIAGHSLGGVVAAHNFVAVPEDYATLGMIASFPAGYDDLGTRAGSPILSIVGANDGSADLTKVASALLEASPLRLLATVDGLNHYDWADDVTEQELAKDGPRGRDVALARVDAMRVIDTWLDATLLKDPRAIPTWLDGDFAGVEEVR